MKKAVQSAMRLGKGCKVVCSGRLGGAEIARTENIMKVVFHYTLRGDIDYSTAEEKQPMVFVELSLD